MIKGKGRNKAWGGVNVERSWHTDHQTLLRSLNLACKGEKVGLDASGRTVSSS